MKNPYKFSQQISAVFAAKYSEKHRVSAAAKGSVKWWFFVIWFALMSPLESYC